VVIEWMRFIWCIKNDIMTIVTEVILHEKTN
jgi:hypothetical protein